MAEQANSLRFERDVRIDFFRGVALYMILVDHVVGDPLSKVTYQRFGFSDAAELFVFLSGVSCAIVYSRLLAKLLVGLSQCDRQTDGQDLRLLPSDEHNRHPSDQCRRFARDSPLHR